MRSLVAMASEKNFWQPKFWRKSPIGDQQIKTETYLKRRHARRAGVIFFVNKKPLEVANDAYQSIVKP